MNERIKELAVEAGMVIINDKFSTYGKFAEKFAELIVKECMYVVEDAGGIDKYHYTRAISQHFGVEE